MILNVCDSGDVLSALRIVRIAIIIIKIVVPIILIVSLMINYMSAVSSKDNDALSRANKNLVPKVISALLVFFIPTFIGLIADATSNSVDYMNCISNATSEGVNNAYKSEAKNYIETARNSLNKSDYNIAAVSIGKVQDESDKNALKNELSIVSKYITLKERINKLKTNYDEAEYKKIKNEINAISDNKIKKELLELLEKTVPGVDFRHEKQLVTNGKLDSIGIVSIVIMLQDEFDLELNLDELTSSNFESVEEIKDMLSKYVQF